jgi:general secretion pathway protein D
MKNSMKLLRIVLASILAMAISAPTYSDQANSAFKDGVRAESQIKYDTAFEAYGRAVRLKPKDPKYMVSYLRVRALAAAEHLQKGKSLRDNLKLQEALAEFQRSVEIDSTNSAAQQELRSTADMIKKQAEQAAGAPAPKPESPLTKMAKESEGPVDLEPFSDTPLTLRMTTTSDNVYKTIGKLAGINVLFDLDYRPQRINIELDDVPLREALRMVALESKTFWRPISSKAIFVASETRRKEFEDNVMTTFYVRNASTPAELNEVVGTLKGILDINRIQVNPTHGTITLRGTPDQMVLAQKLITDLDKPKAEVVIEIAVLEVNRDRMRTLGTTVPTHTDIAFKAPTAATVTLGHALNGGIYGIAVPSGSFDFLMSDSNTKVLQNPQLRVVDQGKATLKIGDRVPVATGSFASVAGGGTNPLVNTQFQYLDVGVNIEITPHVLTGGEVTLKMVLEVSTIVSTQNVGGINQPTIGQRHIEHETRLGDGEINLVGGILEDSETQSLSGYPWLGNIPILKYLFGQENKERKQTEIVFAIIPHIVRAEEVTEENTRLIDIGTGTSIDLRRAELAKKAGAASQPAKPAASGATAPRSSVAVPARPTS